jgi:hypothetical protein
MIVADTAVTSNTAIYKILRHWIHSDTLTWPAWQLDSYYARTYSETLTLIMREFIRDIGI